MTKPRLIIIVRHAQSEGNKNRDIHQSIPDHRVKLTPEGVTQAHEAGRRLRHLLRPDDTIHFFTSPYRRTRETTEGILHTLTSDEPEPSPFRRSNIKVYEEPRLREQDFGNFQPCSAEMERMWQERADYGHFFYRIPDGESAADAYDRISGFNESLWRQFGEDDFASVCVLVTHGLMSRVFLMKWYHFTVEYFEDLRNVNHCEFLIMRKQENGKYFLENNLRTWSELRRERALHDKGKEKHTAATLTRSKTYKSTRRWGGCPNGCDHTSHYKQREDLEAMRQKDDEQVLQQAPSGKAAASNGESISHRPRRHVSLDEEDQSDAPHPPHIAPIIDVTTVEDEVSQDRRGSHNSSTYTPNSTTLHHLHLGRDFGGTYSGHTSASTSEDGEDGEASAEEIEARSHKQIFSLNARIEAVARGSTTTDSTATKDGVFETNSTALRDEDVGDEENGSHGGMANRLGDAGSDADIEPEMDDFDREENNDRSIKGSVY